MSDPLGPSLDEPHETAFQKWARESVAKGELLRAERTAKAQAVVVEIGDYYRLEAPARKALEVLADWYATDGIQEGYDGAAEVAECFIPRTVLEHLEKSLQAAF